MWPSENGTVGGGCDVSLKEVWGVLDFGGLGAGVWGMGCFDEGWLGRGVG